MVLLLIEGFVLAKLWRNIIWIKITTVIKIPIKKWYIKIRFKVTHAELQINSAITIPRQGKTAIILVVTVIPQWDIWPRQGKWPRNPSIIVNNHINQPDVMIKKVINLI